MKVILVPTDFSQTAENAINYAIAIATKEEAKIVIVNGFQIDPAYTRTPFPVPFLEFEAMHAEQRANHHLMATCERIKENHKIECEYMSMFGTPTYVIPKAVKRFKPYMIIMGTNGTNSLSKFIGGTTTARILGRVSCAVIAVPATAKYHGIQRIAYAIDFLQTEGFVLKRLKELHSLFPAHISVLNIYEGSEKVRKSIALRHFKENASQLGIKDVSYRLVKGDNVKDRLSKIARNKRYDLLVMTTHTRSFFESLFDRSLTKRIANTIQIPLMAFNDSYASRRK